MFARDPSEAQSDPTPLSSSESDLAVPLVVCTMFTQTLGMDIAEKVGAACAGLSLSLSLSEFLSLSRARFFCYLSLPL